MRRRIRTLALALAAAVLLLAVASASASALPSGKAAGVGLKAVRDVAIKVIKADKALAYTAYPYLGWRTSGGPWFNACLDWLGGTLKSWGFKQGKHASGPHYWFQTDVPEDETIWSPQYASLEIVGSDGDAVPGQDYHFDFVLNTFDPTSPFYPAGVNWSWVRSHIGTPAEAALNERCHLARGSGFTSPAGTSLTEANSHAVQGELVDVGSVTHDDVAGEWVWSNGAVTDLSGKFIFAATGRSALYNLAVQEGAAASLCAQINSYNNPVIDGHELFPNTVKYAGVGNTDPNHPPAFNLSPMDATYLTDLLASSVDPVMMKTVAVGSLEPMTAQKPLRTLIAEIPGTSKAAEHVAFLGHLQEPGACDNASGVGLTLEVARTMKRLIDSGRLAPPKRTLTFIWGDETIMGSLWKGQNQKAFEGTKAALVMDMVGEDPAKTGGPMRIEKMPDPSAVYQYDVDTLPGQLPDAVDAYVRFPDKHSLWGAGELEYWPYPGHFLNDLYFKAADLVSDVSPKFVVGSNPWEGGSDHDTFLWNTKDVGGTAVPDPKPAVLSWHFTDYVYHSSMDTMGMVSGRELRDVGLTTIEVGYLVASAGQPQAVQMMRIVVDKAAWRFAWERLNSLGSLKWSYDEAVDGGGSAAEVKTAVNAALTKELEVLGAWGAWYRQAARSPRGLLGSAVPRSYKLLESHAVRDIDRMVARAKASARAIAASLAANLK